jgi:hypothetical protein
MLLWIGGYKKATGYKHILVPILLALEPNNEKIT